MLCGPGTPLNGCQVSNLPVAISSRWMPAKPLFWVQSLPSTSLCCGLTMLIWAASTFSSPSSGQYLKVSLLGSNFTLVAWHMLPSHRKFLHFACPGIEPAEILLAETRVPDDAAFIDDHVMRRDGLARQVVFGIDHARRDSGRARLRLELEIPLR